MKRIVWLICVMFALCSIASAESYTDADGNIWTFEVMEDGNACITALEVNRPVPQPDDPASETEDAVMEPEDIELFTVTIPETINGITVTTLKKIAPGKSFPAEKLIIPSSIISIEKDLFFTGSGLQEIEIDPDNPVFEFHDGFLIDKTTSTLILVLGTSFDDSCVVPEEIRIIGYRAFAYSCKNISHLELPSSLEVIEERALTALESLKELTLPVGLKRIGVHAFAESKLKSLEIPASVQFIDSGMLSINTHLAPGNPYFIDQDGFILSADGSCLVDICDRGSLSSNKEIVIPESVREIGPYALAGISCKSLKLPESLISLGEFCINSGTYISDSVLVIPGSVKTISENSIRYSKDIVFEEGVEVLERNALAPSRRGSITLPASLTEIDERAFSFASPRNMLADINFFTVPGSYAESWLTAHGAKSKPVESAAAETKPVETPASEVPAAEGPAEKSVPAETAVSGASGICTGNQVNVRTKPSMNASSIGRLNKGDSLIVLERESEWSKIECSAGVGYIKTQYIQLTQ